MSKRKFALGNDRGCPPKEHQHQADQNDKNVYEEDNEVCILTYKPTPTQKKKKQQQKQKKQKKQKRSSSPNSEELICIRAPVEEAPAGTLNDKQDEKFQLLPLNEKQDEIFLLLVNYLISDCAKIILEYFIFQVPQLINLINDPKKHWAFLVPSQLQLQQQEEENSVCRYHDYNKLSHFRKKFPTISKQKWSDNRILNELVFGTKIGDSFYTEKILTVLIEQERRRIKEQKLLKKISNVEEYFSSSPSSLLDLIIFFILLSECEWTTHGVQRRFKNEETQDKEKWLSFIVWILFYLFNEEALENSIFFHGNSVCRNLISSALYNPRDESIYSTFFSSTYQSNVKKMSTNKLVQILLIGGNKQVSNKMGGHSMVPFVDTLSVKQFGKSRFAAIGIYSKAMSFAVNDLKRPMSFAVDDLM